MAAGFKGPILHLFSDLYSCNAVEQLRTIKYHKYFQEKRLKSLLFTATSEKKTEKDSYLRQKQGSLGGGTWLGVMSLTWGRY